MNAERKRNIERISHISRYAGLKTGRNERSREGTRKTG